MNQLLKAIPVLMAILLPAIATAHDIEVDGIYYKINGNEASVTYRGTSAGSYADEYSGDIVIPATVTANGMTYPVTAIGERAFADCSGLTGITIPNSVTSISYYAFSHCTSLDNVVIPNSITKINDHTFYCCSSLTNVTIGNSVTMIDWGAFYQCSNLKSIDIPNSVTDIGNDAFNGCSSLANVTIGNSVKSIGKWAFAKCSSLENITVAGGNAVYDSHDNCNAIIKTATNELTVGCNNTIIPGSVTSIDDYAFIGSGLTSINIPNSVSKIGYEAFHGCANLTSVNIGTKVKTISDRAFSFCPNLTSITVASGNTILDSRDNCNAVFNTSSNTLIAGCKNTVIPSSTSAIGNWAFEGCTGLTDITLPTGVITLGDYAFSNCENLTNIELPNTLTEINSHAFGSCSSLACIIIPASVNHIGFAAFQGCSNLTSINLPDAITAIDDAIFQYCSSLEDIVIPETVTYIGEEAFANCLGLTEIEIPSATTFIGSGAFRDCTNLTSIVMNNTDGYSLSSGVFGSVSPNMKFYSYISDPALVNLHETAFGFVNGEGNYSGRTLYVPGGSLDKYQTDNRWSPFFGQIVEMGNYLSINDTTAQQGKTIRTPVKIKAKASIKSLQTYIKLPDGLRMVMANGTYLIEPSEHLALTHSIFSLEMANGDICTLCYPINGMPYSSEVDEVLFYITVKVDDNASGDYTIWLNQSQYTTPDNEEILMDNGHGTVTVINHSDLPGDVNGDGVVNVIDVTTLIDMLLGDGTTYSDSNADANNDGVINIVDVTALIDALLGGKQ